MQENPDRRVVFVSPVPPPAGGIATWTRILVENGLPRGYVAEVVNTTVGEDRETFRRGGALREIRRTWRIVGDFLGALRRGRPAVVHLNVDALAAGFLRDAACGLLAHLRGVPVVIHYHGLVSQLAETPGRWLQTALVRAAARRASLNLAMNQPSLRFLEAQLEGRSRVRLLPNFFDNRRVVGGAPPARRAGERLRVVFVAGLTLAKGTALVIEVARRLPEVDFHLLGRTYPETDGLLSDLPENAIPHGQVENEEVLRTMGESHVLLFPTRHPEGFPIVVCEAMALGLAVVSTDVGAIPEMIDHGEGGLIVSPEPDVLAEALVSLLADEPQRAAMAHHNMEKCRRLYAYPRVVGELTVLYDEIQPTT